MDPTRVAAVSAALRTRGPDAEGIATPDGCTLVHRRLRVIDLSPAGDQPMTNESGNVWVVFNGEIYNHRALRDRLASLGHTFRGAADTETIVHGYEEWGDAVVERLEGMFAFAVWDVRRRRLLLARDRVGEKPLYYAEGPGGLVRFGSTIASLHAAGHSRAPALEQLPFLLVNGYPACPATSYEGVRELPPASRIVFGDEPRSGGVVRYWDPPFAAPRVPMDYEQATSAVRGAVTRAVERMLEADVPLGAFLSGGIDSTVVVAVASRAAKGRLRTFSVGFAGQPEYDETAFARAAAVTFGTEHTEIVLDGSEVADTFPELVVRLVESHGGPFGDSSAIPTYLLSREVRRSVTVALTGDGGDEVFCGYLRMLAGEFTERVPPWGRRMLGALAFAPRTASDRSFIARTDRLIAAAALPLEERMMRWTSYWPDGSELVGELSGRAFERSPDSAAWHRERFGRGAEPLARVLEHNFRTYLPQDLLVKADRTSMAHGLELRAPFLDRELVELAARLPAGFLRRGRLTKRILRHAFRDVLPARIARRGKMGFGLPLGAWFRGALKPNLEALLARDARWREVLSEPRVESVVREHLEGRVDHGLRLWLLFTIEEWLRKG